MEIRCRLCGETYENNIEILQDTRFLSMLDYFFELKVVLEEKLPTTVCEGCYEFVERTWQFKEQVDRAQLLLTEILNAKRKYAIVDVTNNPLPNENQDQKNFKQDSVHTIQNNTESAEIVPRANQKIDKPVKKIRGLQVSEAETFSEIDYVNADGTVIPKPGVGGWNTYEWTCSECSAVFCEAEDLQEHVATAHNIISVIYLCLDCPKVYSKYVSFISHVKYHRPFLKYSCDLCYKWYSTSKEMKDHQTSHYEEDPYQCNTCGKRFRVQSLLSVHSRSHLLTHDSERPYPCHVCDKAFKSLMLLRKHSSIHSGLKPHQCDICGKQFRERDTLKEHHRIHTGAMPFTCEFCGKCFRFKGVLTTHRRQHTGERPYSCSECQHHFTNWPNYNKHMKRRHGINTSVNCRTKQDIPPTGKPNRNPPGTVLAAPLPAPPVHVICETNAPVTNET